MRDSGEPGRRPSRRRVLALAAAAALVGSGLAGLTTRRRGDIAAAGLVALSAWQYRVVQHAARRIAAPDDDPDGSIPSADAVDVAGFADRWLAARPAAMRRDFGRLLAYLEHFAPLGAGCLAPFTRLGPAAQDRVLRSLEGSYIGPLRAGFVALKSLVFMGYYRDPRTWAAIGYDGPLVGRPAGGWR